MERQQQQQPRSQDEDVLPFRGEEVELQDRQNDKPVGNVSRAAFPGHVSPDTQSDDEYSKSQKSSFCRAEPDPEPGFSCIDGDIGGTGYNETTVDIVTVPCPGASPVDTWARQSFPEDFFKFPPRAELGDPSAVTDLAGEVILTPGIAQALPKAAFVWVRQGIRKAVSTARVLLYRHQALSEGLTLDKLADDLLEYVDEIRQGLPPSRPLFFIAHSIGGLVAKLALVKASQIPKYSTVMYNTHGISFFGTPHRGSSYLAMKNLKESIQHLLHLQRTLPKSLTEELRICTRPLLKLNDQFMDLASELRIWTFYETMDSQLSGSRGRSNEVQFYAPLVSIKSSLLGARQEKVYAVDCDHADCASFGPNNFNTLNAYLKDLAAAVAKAVELSEKDTHHPLKLEEKVKVEVVGFYEDPDAEMEKTMRLYFAKSFLSDILEKGPESCLKERMSRRNRRRGRGTSPPRNAPPETRPNGLGILTNLPRMLPALPTSVSNLLHGTAGASDSPDIVVTLPSARPLDNEGHNTGEGLPHSLTVPSALPSSALHRSHANRPSSRGSDQTTSTQSEPITHGAASQSLHPGKHERHSSAGEAEFPPLEKVFTGFSRPDPALRKFMWIHLPFTNPHWVKEIFNKLSETHGQNFSRLFNNENWVSRHVQGRHSPSQPSFVKPACNFTPAETATSPRASPNASGRTSPGINPSYLYLYMPYLHFDTYINMIRRRNVIFRRLKQGRTRPVPEDIANLESLELRVIWEYLNFDPPLNFRRTLDQFGQPALRDTYARDDDQMLYKLTKQKPDKTVPIVNVALQNIPEKGKFPPALEHEPSTMKSTVTKKSTITKKDNDSTLEEVDPVAESDLRDGNVLMVDQLWLWSIDTTTLATFFPYRESSPREGTLFQQADLRNSVCHELNGDLTRRTENSLDLAALIVFHAVTVLLDRSSHPDLEIFRIFEEAIGMLAEKMTYNLKQFRMQTFREAEVDDDDYSDPEDNTQAAIKMRHRLELEKAERDNRENTSALLELRDMEDELNTLNKLFDTQETTIKTMRDFYTGKELKDITHNGQTYLNEALARIDEYKQQTGEMIKRVDATRKDYEKMLEMAQGKAQVDDLHWSRLQTELASSQNLAVMIFTTFTIIFLPLTFFTGLFGMNTSEWEGPDGEIPTLAFIGAISLPVSIVLIVGSLVAAFNLHAQGAVRNLYRNVKHLLLGAGALLARLIPLRAPAADREARRRREERQRAEDRARKHKERTYDFWETLRRERGSHYHIPELNRKTDPIAAGVRTRRTWGSGASW